MQENWAKLREVYQRVEEVDLYVGGLSETPVAGEKNFLLNQIHLTLLGNLIRLGKHTIHLTLLSLSQEKLPGKDTDQSAFV